MAKLPAEQRADPQVQQEIARIGLEFFMPWDRRLRAEGYVNLFKLINAA